MKNKPNTICSICHEVILTSHVYSENNLVYLKNDSPGESMPHDGWCPIHFQLIPF